MAFLKALPRTRELAHHDEHVTRHAVCTQPHTRHSGAHPHASVRNKRVPTSPEAERAQKLKGWMFPLPRSSCGFPIVHVAILQTTTRDGTAREGAVTLGRATATVTRAPRRGRGTWAFPVSKERERRAGGGGRHGRRRRRPSGRASETADGSRRHPPRRICSPLRKGERRRAEPLCRGLSQL